MAGGTDGNIISFDSSGNPVAIATGNDGQVLTSAGAGAQPAFEDAGGGGVEADTVMVFFQSAAPTGWTKLTSQNDKTLRVVSGSGGGTGGDWAMSAGETTSAGSGHTHTVAAHGHGHNISAAAHTISIAEMPSHTHGNVGGSTGSNAGNAGGGGLGGTTAATGGGGSHVHSGTGSVTDKAAVATGAETGHTHTIQAPQYIDVIICDKD
jgi:hypothetical protein